MGFPFKVFKDVDMRIFSKHNKKNVTEDFVAENFKLLSWEVYKPFHDTGVDLIIKKRVCPNGHTSWDENELTCSKCGTRCIEITRFIQIKTREVNGNKEEERSFGYTLTSKDFRTDPRHVFLLFSDFTLDFIILPMYDYLKFFYDNKVAGSTHFSTPSFRKKKNNKMNQLIVTEDGNWGWVMGRGRNRKFISFDDYVNQRGIERLSNPTVDIQIDYYIRMINQMKQEMFYSFKKGQSKIIKSKIESIIQEHLRNYFKGQQSNVALIRQQTKQKLLQELDSDLKESIQKYFKRFKGVSIIE